MKGKSSSWRPDLACAAVGLVIGVVVGLLQPEQPQLLTEAALLWCAVACLVFCLAHYAPALYVRVAVQLGIVALASMSVVVILR